MSLRLLRQLHERIQSAHVVDGEFVQDRAGGIGKKGTLGRPRFPGKVFEKSSGQLNIRVGRFVEEPSRSKPGHELLVHFLLGKDVEILLNEFVLAGPEGALDVLVPLKNSQLPQGGSGLFDMVLFFRRFLKNGLQLRLGLVVPTGLGEEAIDDELAFGVFAVALLLQIGVSVQKFDDVSVPNSFVR